MSAANTDRLLLVNRVARDERRVSDRGMRSRGRAAVLAVLAVLVLLVLGATTAFAATTTAYVANASSGTVSVIDTATNMVIATIPVGSGPEGVAVNPAGTRVYVTNVLDGTVSVIDTATNTVIATITVGNRPKGVAVNPAGTRVYVTNRESNTVSVIDTATNTVIATITVGSSPVGVAVNPAGTRVYVTNQDSGTVSVIDTATNTVIATITVGSSPFGVAVNPAGTRVYVTNQDSGTVSVIDTATNTVIATITVGSSPTGVAVNPAGTRVYVTDDVSSTAVIDTATNMVIATITVGSNPEGVAVNPAGTRVYVTNASSGTVSVIDTATNTVIATIPVDSTPSAIAIATAAAPPPSADVALTKSAASMTVQHNQNVTYTLIATNNGPDTAAAPTVTDTLPAGQTFVASGSSSGCAAVGQTVTCTQNADLTNGSMVTFTVVARAGTVGPGQVDSATVSSTTADPNTANNTATARVDVVASADLSVSKSSSPNPAIAGQQVTYTLTVGNAGPDKAVNAVVVDRLPAGTTFQGASPGCTPSGGPPATTVTCRLGDLAPGATLTRQIVVLAGAGSPVNSAAVSSDTADPTAGNNTATTTTTVGSSCTVTRSGSIAGSIVVPAGQFLCLVNASVAGAVIVDPGGALSVTSSTIGGGIDSNGARFVTICGSTVKGSVIIKNTTLMVRVGDDGGNCAPNQLYSSLLVSGNLGGVEVFANTIGGPVSVTNNRGASPLADVAPEVEGNHISGALACSGNIPPVTNDGVTNTAGGAKTGECAFL